MQKIERTAIVTGAAQGIGAAIAARFAADGYSVGIIDRRAGDCEATLGAIAKAGMQGIAAEADVSDEEAVARAVAEIAASLGPATILVNNAGFARDVAFSEMSLADWDAVQGVHLRGSFLMTRAVLPGMTAARWGRIVNISSISAQGHAGRVNYCAAKAGMHGFVRSLAVELGPSGITANAIAPGLIVTAMTTASARRRGLSLEDHIAGAAAQIPVRRVGRPEDIAHTAAYLASEGAGFVTGQIITVSGGVIV